MALTCPAGRPPPAPKAEATAAAPCSILRRPRASSRPNPSPTPWPPTASDIILETATGDNLLAETTEAGTSILTEASDSYYSFMIIQESYSLATIDPQSDNAFIDTQADLILDFTETNPFGEPTNSI